VQGLIPPDVLVDTWAWDFGANATPASATNAGPHSVVFATPGLQTIALTVSNIGGSNTITQQIYVGELPSATFTEIANQLVVTFTNTSAGGGTYLWSFGDGTTSTSFSPVHTYATDGVYSATLSVTNHCGTVTSVTHTVTVMSIGADDLAEQVVRLQLYPNPASTQVWLVIDQAKSGADGALEVFSTDGRLLIQKRVQLTQGQTKIAIDVQPLPAGRYLVRLQTVTGVGVAELIVE
jgi:PKD repeat protein